MGFSSFFPVPLADTRGPGRGYTNPGGLLLRNRPYRVDGKGVGRGDGHGAGVEVVLRSVDDVSEQEILQADGILVGTPVHWGSLSARVKDFLDKVGGLLDTESHGEGRTGGAFCTGGAVSSGKELARLAILAAFLNLRFVAVGGLASDGSATWVRRPRQDRKIRVLRSGVGRS